MVNAAPPSRRTAAAPRAAAQKTPPRIEEHAIEDAEALRKVTNRIRRAEGQLRGVVQMLQDGRPCQDVVAQLSAASKAIDRAAFTLIAAGLKECLVDNGGDVDAVSEQMQKLFLTMA
jgi:DNA-binding FrmR family transcriptional regulator